MVDWDVIAKEAGIDITVEHVEEIGDTTHCVKDPETEAILQKAKETGEKQILTKYYWKFDDQTITIYILPNGYVITTSQEGNLVENI